MQVRNTCKITDGLLQSEIERVLADVIIRKEMGERGQAMMDGRGAYRVLGEIEKIAVSCRRDRRKF